MDPKIQQFIASLPEHSREPAMRLRDIFLAIPGITEAIKWNALTFSNGKTNLAFIYTYKGMNYINLGFMQATALADPKKLFEGTGKGMRHIKVRTVKDIPAPQVKKWIKEAVKMAEK
jgi:hypothetical protein